MCQIFGPLIIYQKKVGRLVLMKVETKRKLTIVALLLFASAIAVILTLNKPVPPKKPIQDKRILVELLQLKPSRVTFQVDSQGTVLPRTKTELSSEVSGRITAISNKFIAGGFFKKNEILMQIDDTDYLAAQAQAQALVKQRQIEYKGAKSLSKKGFRADAELAAAKANLTAAESNLVKASKNLQRTKIRLPYDGFVLSKNSDIGQYVNPGSKLGTTFSTKTAEIRLALTEQDLRFTRLPKPSYESTTKTSRAKVILSTQHHDIKTSWNAEIIRSEGTVDQKSRVTYVVAEIKDPYKLSSIRNDDIAVLPIGTFVTARIEGKSFNNIIKIPRTALRGKNELMFVDNDNKLQIREVTILKTDADFAYISAGAKTGDRISITAIESPINGMEVRTQFGIKE